MLPFLIFDSNGIDAFWMLIGMHSQREMAKTMIKWYMYKILKFFYLGSNKCECKTKRLYLYKNQYVQVVFWLRLDYITYNIVHETESWLRQIDLDTMPYYEVHILNSDTNYANTISIIYKKIEVWYIIVHSNFAFGAF